MQVGTGKSVLNGIAIGKLKIYKKKDTAISAAEVADTAAEVARFEEAQQKAIEQQTALYEKALAEAGEDIAEVFNIHAMMLEDDDFVDAIKEIINGQKKCAEYAVKTAGNNQAAVFAAMDDPYLQARSADVIDIAQAILDILQGVDNASLQGTEPSILVAEDLAAADIPIVTENSLLLSTHPLVIQSVALLQFLCNAEDELALWTVVTGSLVQQGPLPVPDLQALHDSCVDRGSIPLVQHLQRNFPGFWASVLAPFHNQAGLMTPYDTVMEWYDRLQVFERYPDADVFLRCFLEVLKNAEDQGLATLPDFLAHWQEKGEEEKVPMPEGIDAVRIMTVHKSKGLEAPVVLLPWTDATLKASDPVLMEEDGLRMVCKNGPHCGRVYYEALLRQAMELLNQFYVAFTRAREELLVFRTSAATVRKGCGSHALDVLWQQAGLEVPYLLEGGDDVLHPVQPAVAEEGEDDTAPAAENAGDDSASDQLSGGQTAVPHDPEEDWRPMQWLPRLKIYRNPLERMHFSARDRGTLLHACLEQLPLGGLSEDNIRAAVREVLATIPLADGQDATDRESVATDMESCLLWLLRLPQFGLWQRRGVPEQSMLAADGSRRDLLRADLIVPLSWGTLVVDYKSGRVMDEHVRQVQRYLRCLEQSGTTVARGLLIYLDRQSFRLVEPDSASELFTDLGAYPRYFCEDEA